jgi:hypothetical protein
MQGLLSSYVASGRRFSYNPQAYNNDAYWRAMNYNSSGMFWRDTTPYGTIGF